MIFQWGAEYEKKGKQWGFDTKWTKQFKKCKVNVERVFNYKLTLTCL